MDISGSLYILGSTRDFMSSLNPNDFFRSHEQPLTIREVGSTTAAPERGIKRKAENVNTEDETSTNRQKMTEGHDKNEKGDVVNPKATRTSMRILHWNCLGWRKSMKVYYLKEICANHSPHIMFLAETLDISKYIYSIG